MGGLIALVMGIGIGILSSLLYFTISIQFLSTDSAILVSIVLSVLNLEDLDVRITKIPIPIYVTGYLWGVISIFMFVLTTGRGVG